MAGRPLKFATVEELQQKIDDYFAVTVPAYYTITGLALALDTDRSTLCEYGDGNRDDKDPRYSYTIKEAKTRIEHGYELSLRTRGSAGDIFGLKNFGWTDQQQIDHTTNGKDLPTPILGGSSVHRDNSDQ